MGSVTGGKGDLCHPAQRIPDTPPDPERFEHFDAAGKPFAGCVHIPNAVFNVSQEVLSLRDHTYVARAPCEREGTCGGGARKDGFSLCVVHHRRAGQPFQLGGRRKRRQPQNLFVPSEAFGRVSAD